MKQKLIQRFNELNSDRFNVDREYLWPIMRDMIRIRFVLQNRYSFTINFSSNGQDN